MSDRFAELKDTPDFGHHWWSPPTDAFVCRHLGDPDATIELETDLRRERATHVYLHLGALKK